MITKSIKSYLGSFADIVLLAKVFIYDFLLVISFYLTFALSKIIMRSPLNSLNNVDLGSIAEKSIEELQSAAYSMKNFFIALILTIIGLFLLMIILYSIFQGLAWSSILKKRFNIRYLLRFSLLNLIWFTSLAIILFILLLGSNQSALNITLAILLSLASYLTIILANLFTKENKFKQLKQTFKIGILRIHHFMLPLILIIITVLVAKGLYLIYQSTINLQPAYLSIFLSILLFSWIKIYFASIVKA